MSSKRRSTSPLEENDEYNYTSKRSKKEKNEENDEDDDGYVAYVPLKERKKNEVTIIIMIIVIIIIIDQMERLQKYKMTRNKIDEQVKLKEINEDEETTGVGPRSKMSLLDQHTELKKKAEGRERERERVPVSLCVISDSS